MLETLKRNESFSYKKLTKEEMESRGILGRLVGPCADFTIPTRNGRKYNERLWENVFKDEIVLEKINNKCLFGELGHPIDREEVDPEKIAIALNEKPVKDEDGKLIACFDILNTPSGKILKTLCDYGTTIGISSRGSGDIIDEMGEEVVDPETYMFECFDAVLLPAVKAARLKYMTESVDSKNRTNKLKKALRESIERAPEEEKEIMKNTLEDLDISLDEELEEDEPIEIIPASRKEPVKKEQPLVEEEVEPSEEEIEVEEQDVVEETEEETFEVEEQDVEPIDDIEDVESVEEENVEDIIEETTSVATVSELISELKDFDEDAIVEFKPIVIEDKEYNFAALEFDSSEAGKVVVNIDYSLSEVEEDNNIQSEEEILEVEEEPALEGDAEVDEAEEVEKAEDNGEEVLESLKELVRQKDLLEQELKTLKCSRTVEDSKVKELKEELNKYKEAFARTSKIAAKVKVVEGKVKSLSEQLDKKTTEFNKLKSVKISELKESTNAEKQKMVALNEQLKSAQTEIENLRKKIDTETAGYEKKLAERSKVARSYKLQCSKILEQYISFRAEQLGIRPSEIINRVGNKVSFEKINDVCDRILSENISYSRPYSINKNSKVVIKESKENFDKDDYDWDSLYELAGLNK